MGDSKLALPCTLAKQCIRRKETIPCGDSACQKVKMRDVFPPPFCFRKMYLSHLSVWESVSLVPSQDPTCEISPVSEIFIRTTSRIFYSDVKRQTVSGKDVVFKESKSYIAQCHQARDNWRIVWGQGPVARALILFVSMFSYCDLVQSVIYLFSGMMQLSAISWACGLTFLSPLSCSFPSQHCIQECFQDPWSLISSSPPSLHTHMEVSTAQLEALL